MEIDPVSVEIGTVEKHHVLLSTANHPNPITGVTGGIWENTIQIVSGRQGSNTSNPRQVLDEDLYLYLYRVPKFLLGFILQYIKRMITKLFFPLRMVKLIVVNIKGGHYH